MTWSVTTGKSVLLADGQEQTECNFSDGVSQFQDHLSHVAGSLDSLTQVCRNRIAKQDALTKPPPLIPANTVIDLSPVPPPVVVPPTQAQIDQAAFYVAVNHELCQQRFATLSAKTQGMMTDPAWLDGMPH